MKPTIESINAIHMMMTQNNIQSFNLNEDNTLNVTFKPFVAQLSCYRETTDCQRDKDATPYWVPDTYDSLMKVAKYNRETI